MLFLCLISLLFPSYFTVVFFLQPEDACAVITTIDDKDYSDSRRVWDKTGREGVSGFIPLLVNLQSMTAKPRAGGGQRKLRRVES